MDAKPRIMCIIGPTASGKSSRAIEEAFKRNGEIISVDSRQVYRTLDIGTEKITREEMRGIPHYLIDIRDPEDTYSAGDFVEDANCIIYDIARREKMPILAGGTHFYFDALLHGLPEDTPANEALRASLERRTNEELCEEIMRRDPRRAKELDPKNRRRLIRALEIIDMHGLVPKRTRAKETYEVEWIVLAPSDEELRERIALRLKTALTRGLVEEVRRVRERLAKTVFDGSPDHTASNAAWFRADERLNELGLEYKIVGEYLRGERSEESLLPTLLSKLWQYARRQKAWIRKLTAED